MSRRDPPPTHRCPGTIGDCYPSPDVEQDKLACIRHWAMVARPLQRAVYNAWDRGRGFGSAEHAHAITAAIESMNRPR